MAVWQQRSCWHGCVCAAAVCLCRSDVTMTVMTDPLAVPVGVSDDAVIEALQARGIVAHLMFQVRAPRAALCRLPSPERAAAPPVRSRTSTSTGRRAARGLTISIGQPSCSATRPTPTSSGARRLGASRPAVWSHRRSERRVMGQGPEQGGAQAAGPGLLVLPCASFDQQKLLMNRSLAS